LAFEEGTFEDTLDAAFVEEDTSFVELLAVVAAEETLLAAVAEEYNRHIVGAVAAYFVDYWEEEVHSFAFQLGVSVGLLLRL
jgi:hypothetical protein